MLKGAQGVSRADTSYSCFPGGKTVTTHCNFSYGQSPTSSEAGRARAGSTEWPCPSLSPPGLAPRSAVGSGCPGSSPHSPESQERRYERKKEMSFSRDAAKHQLNPKQRKLQPWELTYIILHVLFWGSELLVIRAAARWVNQPKTESKCQQSSQVPGQGLLNLSLISTETSAIATRLASLY